MNRETPRLTVQENVEKKPAVVYNVKQLDFRERGDNLWKHFIMLLTA